MEQERLEQEKLEKEKLEQEKLEQEKIKKEKLEKERLEKEKLEKERLEQEKLEKEKLEKERLEKERLEQEKIKKEQLEKAKKQYEKVEKELQKEKKTKTNRPDIISPSTQTPKRNTQKNTSGVKPPTKIKRKTKLKKQAAARTVYHSERAMPDYQSMDAEEQARWRADFRVKIGILRQAYSDFDIPSFDDSIPLEVIHQHYERYVQQIHIDNSVGNYKVYLLILFAGIELFCVKILGLDMGGYCINQLTMMNKYERLLVELGEKSSVSVGSEWPVEARICGLALFNALVFLVVRLFSSYLGDGLGSALQSIVNSFLTKEDASEHIKKAQGITTSTNEEYADGSVPEPPEKGGSFDLSNLIGGLSGMLGGGGNKPKKKASRRPEFSE